jgi:hypothetical protein
MTTLDWDKAVPPIRFSNMKRALLHSLDEVIRPLYEKDNLFMKKTICLEKRHLHHKAETRGCFLGNTEVHPGWDPGHSTDDIGAPQPPEGATQGSRPYLTLDKVPHAEADLRQ